MVIYTLRPHQKGEKAHFFKKESSYKTQSLEMWSEQQTPTQIDGDISHDLPVKISLEPAALQVILPKKIAKKHLKRARKLLKKKK